MAPPPTLTTATLTHRVLSRHLPNLTQILFTAPYVHLYTLSHSNPENPWDRADIEGSLFICHCSSDPSLNLPDEFHLLLLNRKSLTNFRYPLHHLPDTDAIEYGEEGVHVMLPAIPIPPVITSPPGTAAPTTTADPDVAGFGIYISHFPEETKEVIRRCLEAVKGEREGRGKMVWDEEAVVGGGEVVVEQVVMQQEARRGGRGSRRGTPRKERRQGELHGGAVGGRRLMVPAAEEAGPGMGGGVIGGDGVLDRLFAEARRKKQAEEGMVGEV